MPKMDKEDQATIIKKLQRYFKKDRFKIEYEFDKDYDHYYVNNPNYDEDAEIDEDMDDAAGWYDKDNNFLEYDNNTFSILSNTSCITITFNNSILDDIFTFHIDLLKKCTITGSESLNKIEKFAKSFPQIKTITLDDRSTMELCERPELFIYLNIFYILHSGISWYNSKGYYSSNFDREREHNRRQIERPIIDFLSECIERTNLVPNKKEMIRGIELFYTRDYKDISVTDFFNTVKRIVRKETDFCNDPKYRWLSDILKIILFSRVLNYDSKLVKTLDKNSLNKTRRIRSSPRSSPRSKKTRSSSA
jgi:hypothetical protein